MRRMVMGSSSNGKRRPGGAECKAWAAGSSRRRDMTEKLREALSRCGPVEAPALIRDIPVAAVVRCQHRFGVPWQSEAGHRIGFQRQKLRLGQGGGGMRIDPEAVVHIAPGGKQIHAEATDLVHLERDL